VSEIAACRRSTSSHFCSSVLVVICCLLLRDDRSSSDGILPMDLLCPRVRSRTVVTQVGPSMGSSIVATRSMLVCQGCHAGLPLFRCRHMVQLVGGTTVGVAWLWWRGVATVSQVVRYVMYLQGWGAIDEAAWQECGLTDRLTVPKNHTFYVWEDLTKSYDWPSLGDGCSPTSPQSSSTLQGEAGSTRPTGAALELLLTSLLPHEATQVLSTNREDALGTKIMQGRKPAARKAPRKGSGKGVAVPLGQRVCALHCGLISCPMKQDASMRKMLA
jgi:hypothetical protein